MKTTSHEITPPPGHERVILVAHARGTRTERAEREHLERSLDELALLADTAGAIVADKLVQRRGTIHPATFLGKGKVEELKQLAEMRDAEVVIFDDDLTPAQVKNLEKMLNRKVIDRSELILDIFARRARTRESRLQVELAQLEYTLPRLTGMWKHLERQAGGIGTRGPGETQLETDRRMVREKIARLKRELESVERERETQRARRRREFRAALVGYTNAGKSTLFNALTRSDVFVENRLFATLDSTTRQMVNAERALALVTDTVGFIRKLPHHLVASFRATLEETNEADLVLHVIDASAPLWEEQRVVVEQVLDELGATERPKLMVFNKIDLLPEATLLALQERVCALIPSAIYVSTVSEGGLEPLRRALEAATRTRRPVTTIRVSVSDGRTLAEIHQSGEVLDQQVDGDSMVVTARVDEVLAGRLRKAGATVSS